MNQSASFLRTCTLEKMRGVIVTDDSLLSGIEGPMCQPDPSHSYLLYLACCLHSMQCSTEKVTNT